MYNLQTAKQPNFHNVLHTHRSKQSPFDLSTMTHPTLTTSQRNHASSTTNPARHVHNSSALLPLDPLRYLNQGHLLRSIHTRNRQVYALLEPQLNRFEYPWGEWSKNDIIYIYQDVYGSGTSFLLFFSQDPAFTSSVGAFLPRKDVLRTCVEELVEGGMVRVGRVLGKQEGELGEG